MQVQWQNPIGLSRTIVGNLSGYVEFYDAVSSGDLWVGTLDTGLIYQVTPNFSIDVNSFFGLTAALLTTMCLGIRLSLLACVDPIIALNSSHERGRAA